MPHDLRSKIIYKYECCICQDTHIGSTCEQAKVRISQHLGRSFRTNNPLTNPPHSSPRIHAEEKQHPFKPSDFTILDSATPDSDLRILESLYIFKLRPNLNVDSSVYVALVQLKSHSYNKTIETYNRD